MSDTGGNPLPSESAIADQVQAQAAMQAGAMLRQAREAAGLHIAALAVSLKVPVGKLEALEAGDITALPDTVFVRALASSVCRNLKMDAAPVLALLPQTKNPRLATDEAGINAPVKGATLRAAVPLSGGGLPRSVIVTVSLLLLGALVLLFLPQLRAALAPFQSTSVAVESALPASVQERATSAQEVSMPEPPMVASAAVVPAPATGMEPASVASSVMAAIKPISASAAVGGASSASVSGADLLTLKARGQSWVQVKDGSGAVLFQRNVADGEIVPLSGKTPLSVIVGRAEVTEVLVRGQRFDLAPVTRDNVARFEVK